MNSSDICAILQFICFIIFYIYFLILFLSQFNKNFIFYENVLLLTAWRFALFLHVSYVHVCTNGHAINYQQEKKINARHKKGKESNKCKKQQWDFNWHLHSKSVFNNVFSFNLWLLNFMCHIKEGQKAHCVLQLYNHRYIYRMVHIDFQISCRGMNSKNFH